MARPPAPPGPPPPHHRPPGTPPTAADPFGPLGRGPIGSSPLGSSSLDAGARPAPSGVGPGAATALAVVMLLVGVIGGFFLGRAYDDDGEDASAGPVDTAAPSPTTTPPTGDTIPQEAPGGPPSTDLPPTSLGTPDAPIPPGQAYVLGLYEIEVRGVDRDATEALADHDAGNPAPAEGRRHVLVEVAVRFTDAAGYGNPGSIPFFVSDGTVQWSAFDNSCGRLPRPLTAAGLITQGDEAVGQVCFTVPDDAVDELAFGTESFSGPLWFALP